MSDSLPGVLVTGATGGLGRALADAFCRAGYHVLAAARDAEALDSLVAELRDSGEATGIVCDVAEPAELRRLAEEIDRLGGTLHAAVVNAGGVARGGFMAPLSALEEWRDMVLANVFGAAATARVALPALARTRGSLFFIGSVVGRASVPGDLYSVTKHAVSALAESLRLEFADSGVHVCVVQPGLMDTPLVSPERRNRPMMDPAQVAAQIVRLAAGDRPFDVGEIVLRARPSAPAQPQPAPATERTNEQGR